MRYKKSSYNIIIDTLENGNILLFNSLNGSFGIMRKEVKRTYDNIENILVEDIDSSLQEHIKNMKDNGFLVDFDSDEYGTMQVRENLIRYSNKASKGLTIAPTLACNMDCPYCYEAKNNNRMTEEVKKSLVKFVSDYLKEATSFSVSWYGGEPLLEKNTIEELSKEFIEICKQKDIPYFASIVTNGILLDYETAKILKEECNVYSAQVTIDGLKEVNNERRRLKNRGDSFKIITDNIESVKDILPISIRVNIDKTNIDEMDKLIYYFLKERKWGNNKNVGFYFAPVMNITEACNANKDTCFNWEEFSKLAAKASRTMYSLGHSDSIKKLIPRPRQLGCAALTINSYVVDPQGDIYKCWDLVGIKDYRVGDINSGILLNKENIKWLTLQKPAECSKCEHLPTCQGGCPYIRLNNNNLPACSHNKLSYKENLKILHEQYEKNKKTS